MLRTEKAAAAGASTTGRKPTFAFNKADAGPAAGPARLDYERDVQSLERFLLTFGSEDVNSIMSMAEDRIETALASELNLDLANERDDRLAQRLASSLLEVDTRSKYTLRMLKAACERSRSLVIDLDDLVAWRDPELRGSSAAGDEDLVRRMARNTMRYLALSETAAHNVWTRLLSERRARDPSLPDFFDDERARLSAADILRSSRVAIHAQAVGATGQKDDLLSSAPVAGASVEKLPPKLYQAFEIIFRPVTKAPRQSLREVRAAQIGHLVRVNAIVVRVGEVLPRITVAAYLCDKCGCEIYQNVEGKSYTPLSVCEVPDCQSKKGKPAPLHIRLKNSAFARFQEIRVQELPEQVPIGNVPRTMIVEARGDCTRACTPGDVVEIVGVLLPEKRPGVSPVFNAASSGESPLVSATYLHAMSVTPEKKSRDAPSLHDEEFNHEFEKLMRSRKAYDLVSRSIAPEIYGHEDVKKAILLMMVGGISKQTVDGMRIRGDINVALFGDPGVAKSQLLKHVATVAPRAVYTTGKGSSGVGLTAAVNRDAFSGEMTLEGGALVMADMGICLIDEFDKMQDSDRTAIHEVMEQQTVSIAKAGITTTLNARTAILAAANPLYGRYDRRKSPVENINLPTALLSRFDLLFLLIDKVDEDTDRRLAEHVTYVHRFQRHPELNAKRARRSLHAPSEEDEDEEEEEEAKLYDSAFVRNFVSRVRTFNPVVPSVAEEKGRRLVSHLVEAYVAMRTQDSIDAKRNHAKSALTPRQLLSILRLASALARVRCAEEIAEEDVDEAIRLVRVSKSSLEEDESPEEDGETGTKERDDPKSRVYRKLVEVLNARRDEEAPFVSYDELEERVLKMGLTRAHMDATLQEYADMGVLFVNKPRTKIRMLRPREEEEEMLMV